MPLVFANRLGLPAATAPNRREYDRTALRLPGQLYLPAEQSAQSCIVTDLSAGGARLVCEDVPPVSAFVILTIEGFGRFDAVTTRFVEGALGVNFLVPEGRRAKLLRQIEAFLDSGISGAAVCGAERDS
ncbi:MAG TPA: PilZ domain-containing protein [Rhizomicrobium sp.]